MRLLLLLTMFCADVARSGCIYGCSGALEDGFSTKLFQVCCIFLMMIMMMFDVFLLNQHPQNKTQSILLLLLLLSLLSHFPFVLAFTSIDSYIPSSTGRPATVRVQLWHLLHRGGGRSPSRNRASWHCVTRHFPQRHIRQTLTPTAQVFVSG